MISFVAIALVVPFIHISLDFLCAEYTFRLYHLRVARCEVELLLHQFLQLLDEVTAAENTAGSAEQGPRTRLAIEQARALINALFAVEREMTTASAASSQSAAAYATPLAAAERQAYAAIYAAIREWLCILIDCLFRIGSVADHVFVLQHSIRARGVTSGPHW